MLRDSQEKITISEFVNKFEKLISDSLSQLVLMELSIITSIINMYQISGKKEEDGTKSIEDELNVIGIGFGAIYANVIIKGLQISLNNNNIYLMSSCFKRHDYFGIGICYQRSLILCGTLMIIITPILAASETILLFAEFFKRQLVHQSMQYVWEMLPALYAFSYFDSTKSYLTSMGITIPVIIIQIFTFVLHLMLSKKFIIDLNLGIRGAAWAKNFSSCTSALLIYLFIYKYQSTHPAWIEWDKRSLKSILFYAKQLLFQSLKHYAQSNSFDLMGIIALGLKFEEFCVCICLIFTALCIYMVYLGFAKTASNQISECIRDQNFIAASNLSRYHMLSGLFMGVLAILLIQQFQDEWLTIFYMDAETKKVMVAILPFFCITIIIGGCQMMFIGILNSIGKESFVINLQLVTQYIIGIGSGLYLAYQSELGLIGLWIGWTFGLLMSGIIFFAKIFTLDWKYEGMKLLVPIEEN